MLLPENLAKEQLAQIYQFPKLSLEDEGAAHTTTETQELQRRLEPLGAKPVSGDQYPLTKVQRLAGWLFDRLPEM